MWTYELESCINISDHNYAKTSRPTKQSERRLKTVVYTVYLQIWLRFSVRLQSHHALMVYEVENDRANSLEKLAPRYSCRNSAIAV